MSFEDESPPTLMENGWLIHPVSTLAAIWDVHVKDMGKAVCGSFSWGLTQDVTSDMLIVMESRDGPIIDYFRKLVGSIGQPSAYS